MAQQQLADIPALVRRLQHGSEAEQAEAVAALRNIVLAAGDSRDAIAAEMEAADAVNPALLQLFGGPSEHPAAADAASLLCGLTFQCPERCQAVISAADGAPFLVRCLDSSSVANAQAYAATALANIAANADEAGNAALVAAGGIPPAIRRLSSADDSVAERAALLVRNISTSAEPKDAIFEAGGIPLLICLLRRPSQATLLRLFALQRGSGAIVQHAAAALSHLTFGEGSGPRITAIAAAGGIAPLVELLATSGDATAVDAAARVVHNMLLLSPASIAPTVTAAGGAWALVRCLHGQHFSDAHEWAAKALSLLARGGEPPIWAIAAAGGTSALLQAFARPCSPAVKAAVASALLNLLLHGQAAAVAAADGTNVAASALASLPSTADVAEALSLLAAARSSMPGANASPAPAAQAASPATAPAAAPSNAAAAANQPAAPHSPRVCAAPGCGATNGLRRCTACGSVRYCGEACMRAHWTEHRPECRRLRAVAAAAGGAAGLSGGA